MADTTLPAFTWRRYGEHGILLEVEALADVHMLHRSVLAGGLAAESVPGATTLYVEARPELHLSPASLASRISELPAVDTPDDLLRTHSIPVRYDGPDLEDVASLTGLAVEEVIRRHSAPTYTVAFIGFSRGFAYFAGLDPTIVVPRLATPRTVVPKGSVAMGAGFTGVYPATSPGGWRLLGMTTKEFFDPEQDPPTAFAIGDHVRFERVTP
jgi:KipI family sensor histidine kinase inhibitor